MATHGCAWNLGTVLCEALVVHVDALDLVHQKQSRDAWKNIVNEIKSTLTIFPSSLLTQPVSALCGLPWMFMVDSAGQWR
jgi:hypothetical protein